MSKEQSYPFSPEFNRPAPNVQLLNDESEVCSQTYERRGRLVHGLRDLPKETLSRMLIFQPSVGCLNRCTFCSQGAGNQVRYLEEESLRDIFSALKTVADEREIAQLGEAREHKPGVIFPYLDNDSMSYPELDTFIALAGDNLNTKVRLSSVTYSRNNSRLQAMHERIAGELCDYVDGVRFSWTPFTYAWAVDNEQRGVSAEEYTKDFANAIATYKPLLEKKGPGRNTCCIEMRLKPCEGLADDVEMSEANAEGQLSLKAGPYTILTLDGAENLGEDSYITKLDKSRPVLSNDGARSLVILGTPAVGSDMLQESAYKAYEAGNIGEEYQALKVGDETVLARVGQLYRFKNADGEYFAVDPYQLESGKFHALHLYPKTDARPHAGYLDATRFVMNAIIDTKAELGHSAKDLVEDATPEDIARVVAILREKSNLHQNISPHLTNHLETNILPMAEGLTKVFRYADLHPSLFFHRHFVVDTGQIVNQGRAYRAYFKNLASRSDLPLTPNEEKGYGESLSQSVIRGRTWAFSFTSPEVSTARAAQGKKNLLGALAAQQESGLVVREWDPVLFDNKDASGNPLALHFIPTDLKVRTVDGKEGIRAHHIPGTIALPVQPA